MKCGRIKHHLKHNLWNPNSTILFVGYQAQGTLGRTLVEGAKKVKLFGEEVAVNARIEYIEGYSGHADQEWLLNFIYSFIQKPKHIFLVHGEYEGQKVLRDKIIENAKIPVSIPELGDVYKLDEVPTIISKIEQSAKYRYIRLEILDRIETLKEEIEDMGKIIKRDMRREDIEDEKVILMNDKIKELEQQILKILGETNEK